MSLKILVNNSYIEMDAEDVTVPLTFSIADMKQPDKRKTSSSKTIKLKGTQKNLNVLRNVYSLSISDLEAPLVFTFDPRTRIEAIYEENGIIIFDGLFQVLKAVRNGEAFEFECLLFSNIANVIQSLGDLNITDLDWSQYNHELSQTVVRNSFDTSVIRDGAPVSNFNTTTGIPFGFGYVYGWFDLGLDYISNTARNQKTNQILLGVYFKEVLSKMMAAIDQPYTFTLENTELWSRLTLFNEGGQITEVTQDSLDEREVDADYIIPQPLQPMQGFSEKLEPLVLDVVNIDDSNQIDGDDIIISFLGSYRFIFDGAINFTLTNTFIPTLSAGVNFYIEIISNGVVIGEGFISEQNYIVTGLTTTSYTVVINGSFETSLEAGSIVRARLRVVTQTIDIVFQLNSSNCNINMIGLDAPIVDGSLIEVVRYLPKMKCSEFYKSIMRMFNLYQNDLEDSIQIIPALNYYLGTNSNETEDWSDKLDYSQPIEIEPPNRIQGKNYVFKYKTENDFNHKTYLQEFGSNYGDFTYTVPNTWQVGDNVMEVGFALGIPEQIADSDVIMPSILTLENGNLPKPYKGKAPRVHVYNGLRNNGSTSVIYNSDGAAPIIITNSGGRAYPEFHHMLNPTAPTFDIAFQAPQKLYYQNGTITNANLFTTYWDRFIREITSADSKILTAYFKLSRMDIYNLNFRSLKNIDGVVYRLNLVSDYMGQELTTKCELIKVIEGQSRRIGLVPIGVPVDVRDDRRSFIELNDDTSPNNLQKGQMGINPKTNQMFMNTGFGIFEIQLITRR